MIHMLLPIVLALTAFQPSTGPEPAFPPAPTDVRLHEHPGTVRLIGKLNRPLGTVVTVRGLIVDGPAKGFESGPNFVVQEINGVRTQDAIRLPIRPMMGWNHINEGGRADPPTTGATFEFKAFESGEFVGLPAGASRVAVQTSSFVLSPHLVVSEGRKIDRIVDRPSDFVNREAMLEGTADTVDSLPAIRGDDWVAVLDGPAWTPAELGKWVQAIGIVQPQDNGTFALQGSHKHRSLVRLADQVGQRAKLRGVAWTLNQEHWIEYRGTQIKVKFAPDSKRDVWPHGGPIKVTGVLEHLDAKDGPEWRLVNASIEPTPPLLFPESHATLDAPSPGAPR